MLVVVRLRLPGRLAVAAALSVLAAGVTATPHRALAQSFFDQLFGSFTPRHQAMPESRPAMKSIAGPPIRLQSSRPQADDAEPSERGRHSDRDRHTGRYRTVCVRTCDGFYFPISHTASRSDLSADADVCRSRCGGSEARLFYHPNSGEIGDAVDLTGRSYKSLSNAFLFRKKLVDGCTCKPMPWSTAEVNRHRQYAIAAGIAVPPLPSSQQPVTVVAGNYPAAKPDPSVVAPGSAMIAAAPMTPQVMARDAARQWPSRAGEPTVMAQADEALAMQPAPIEQPMPASTSMSAAAPLRTKPAIVARPAQASGSQAASAESLPARTPRRELRSDSKPDSRPETAKADAKPHSPAKPIRTASAPPAPHPAPRRTVSYASAPSGLGFSSSQYTWPGDAPRYR